MNIRNSIVFIALLAIIEVALSLRVAFNKKDGAVVDLTQDTFEDSVSSANSGPWFVMFHALWCPHCQRATPTWRELAKNVKRGVSIAMVDW